MRSVHTLNDVHCFSRLGFRRRTARQPHAARGGFFQLLLRLLLLLRVPSTVFLLVRARTCLFFASVDPFVRRYKGLDDRRCNLLTTTIIGRRRQRHLSTDLDIVAGPDLLHRRCGAAPRYSESKSRKTPAWKSQERSRIPAPGSIWPDLSYSLSY
jgi:hypothetical protein